MEIRSNRKLPAPTESQDCRICLDEIIDRCNSDALIISTTYIDPAPWALGSNIDRSLISSILERLRNSSTRFGNMNPFAWQSTQEDGSWSPYPPVGPQETSPQTHEFGRVSTSAGLFEPQQPRMYVAHNSSYNPSDGVSYNTEPSGQEAMQVHGAANILGQDLANLNPPDFERGFRWPVDFLYTNPDMADAMRNWLTGEIRRFNVTWDEEKLQRTVSCIIRIIRGSGLSSDEFRTRMNELFGERSVQLQYNLHTYLSSFGAYGDDDHTESDLARIARSSRSAPRRNATPEVITLDSDEENDTVNDSGHISIPQNDNVAIPGSSSGTQANAKREPINFPVSSIPASHAGNNAEIHASPYEPDLTEGSNVSTLDTRNLGISYECEREREVLGAQQSSVSDAEMPIPPNSSPDDEVAFSNVLYDDDASVATNQVTGLGGDVVTSSNSQILHDIPSNNNTALPSGSCVFHEMLKNTQTIRISSSEFQMDVRSRSNASQQITEPTGIPDVPFPQLPHNITNMDRSVGELGGATPNSGFGGSSFVGLGNGSMSSNPGGMEHLNSAVVSPVLAQLEHHYQHPITRSMYGNGISLPSSSSWPSSYFSGGYQPSFLNHSTPGPSSTISYGSSASTIPYVDAVAGPSSFACSIAHTFASHAGTNGYQSGSGGLNWMESVSTAYRTMGENMFDRGYLPVPNNEISGFDGAMNYNIPAFRTSMEVNDMEEAPSLPELNPNRYLPTPMYDNRFEPLFDVCTYGDSALHK